MSRIDSRFNQNWQLPSVKTNKTDGQDSNSTQSNAQTQASIGANTTLLPKLPTVKIPLDVLQVQSGVTIGHTPQLTLEPETLDTHAFQNEQQLQDYINAFKNKGKQPFKPGTVITIGTGDDTIYKTVLDDGSIVVYNPASKSSTPGNGTSINVYDSYEDAVTAIEVGAVNIDEDLIIADWGNGNYVRIGRTQGGGWGPVAMITNEEMKEIEAQLRK